MRLLVQVGDKLHRLAKWLLYMENVEREVVTFVTSIDAGVVVRPGQIIEIADPVKKRRKERRSYKSCYYDNSVTPDDTTGFKYIK